MPWGSSATEARRHREANAGTAWIRYFKDDSTRIRIAPYEAWDEKEQKALYGTDAWLSLREHFKYGLGSFPCGKDFSPPKEVCPGCEDSTPRVRERPKRFYIWALDDQGEARIFKMNQKLYLRFENRAKRTSQDALSEQDFNIIRIGTGKDTDYTPEAGVPYPIDFNGIDFPDIGEALDAEWEKAVEFYGDEMPEAGGSDPEPTEYPSDQPRSDGRIAPKGRTAGPQEPDQPAGDGRITPRSRAANGSQEAAKGPQDQPPADTPRPNSSADDEWKSWGEAPDYDLLEAADTNSLKEWLKQGGIEVGVREPRARVITKAKNLSKYVPF